MTVLLEIKKGEFSYHNSRSVFKNVDFQLRSGQVLSIIGPNGSGKSTLLNCLANLAVLKSGEILLDGQKMEKLPRRTVAQWIGYVPQTQDSVYGYNVRDYTVMGRAPYINTMSMPTAKDYQKADAALEMMGISHLAARSLSEISGGERQQVTIARVITQEPQIIMMDEPTSALDFGNQLKTIKIIRALAEQGYAIIVTTHNPDHAIMLNDTVGVLNREGILTVGSTLQIITEEMLSSVYRTEVKLAFVDAVNRFTCLSKL